MKKPLPYRWLPQDHPETAKMNHEVHSCYRLLWDACWIHEGLPKDAAEIAILCRTPLSDFEKRIWPKVKEYFPFDQASGKHQAAELHFQTKNVRRLRKFQAERVKERWRKEKENIPTVYRINSETEPAAAKASELETSKAADEYRSDTEIIPPVSTVAVQDFKSEPAEYPILTEPIPAVSEEKPEIKTVSREISKSPKKVFENPPDEDSNTSDFDTKFFWLQFMNIWPGSLKEDAADLFWKEITNRSQWHELRRRVSEYRRQLLPWQEPENFTEWFWKKNP